MADSNENTATGPISAMMKSMNDVLNNVGGRVELKRKTRDGVLVPTDEKDLAEADSNARLGQVTELLSRLSPSDSLDWAVNKRHEGNQAFDEKGDFEEALQLYLESLVGSEMAIQGGQHDNAAALDAKTLTLCNMAACCLNLKQPAKAVALCDQVMLFNKSSFRAYSRRAVANAHLEEFDKARSDLEDAMKLASTDGEKEQVEASLQRLEEAIRRDEKATKEQNEFYRRAVQGIKEKRATSSFEDEPEIRKLISRMSGEESTLSWDDEMPETPSKSDPYLLHDLGLSVALKSIDLLWFAYLVLTLGLIRFSSPSASLAHRPPSNSAPNHPVMAAKAQKKEEGVVVQVKELALYTVIGSLYGLFAVFSVLTLNLIR